MCPLPKTTRGTYQNLYLEEKFTNINEKLDLLLDEVKTK